MDIAALAVWGSYHLNSLNILETVMPHTVASTLIGYETWPLNWRVHAFRSSLYQKGHWETIFSVENSVSEVSRLHSRVDNPRSWDDQPFDRHGQQYEDGIVCTLRAARFAGMLLRVYLDRAD